MRGWPHSLVLYLYFLWKEKRSLSSMKMALFGLKWRARSEGWKDPARSTIVRQVMRAAAIDLYHRTNRKFALTQDQVRALVRAARKREERGEQEYGYLACAMLLQYYGIARISEILEAKRKDVRFYSGYVTLDYKGKNAAMREGDTKHIAEVGGEYCAVTELRRRLEVQKNRILKSSSKKWNEPLLNVKGKKVTYSWYRKRLIVLFRECGISPKLFCTHSFRSGAASAALARGESKDSVKRQGGWLSEAVNLYFIPSLRVLLGTTRRLRL